MPAVTCAICKGSKLQPWAKAIDVEYFTVTDKFDFYECPDCRLLQIHPMPVDRLSVIYPSNYYSFASQKKSVVNSIKEWLDIRVFKSILGKLTGKINVLDVGGGSGWMLDVVKSASNQVAITQVVDFDPDAKAVAEKKGHQYFQGTIEAFETNLKFDFVLMLNLIEHVSDPLAVMQKAQQLLTPQGKILIKTPNYISFDANLFRHNNWGGLHCPRHWVIFSKQSFKMLAAKANLKIDQLNYTQGAPFWAVSILAWLNQRGWVNINATRPAYTHPLYGPLTGLFAGFDLLRKPFGNPSQMFIVLSKN